MSSKSKEKIPLLILFLLAVCLRTVTVRLASQVDEGNWIVILEKMVSGKILYKDLVEVKTPFMLFLGYPIFKIFKQNIFLLRFFMILLTSSTIFPLYKIGEYLGGSLTGLIASSLFVLDPVSISWQKFFHVSPLVVPFEIWGFWLILKSLKEKKPFWFFLAGVLAALAFLTKQTGIILLPMFLVVLFLKRKESSPIISIRHLFWFLIGLIFGVSPILIYLLKNQVFKDFFYFTFSFYRQFGQAHREAVYLLNPYFEKTVFLIRFAAFNPMVFLLAIFSIFIFQKKVKHFLYLLYFWLFAFLTYYFFILHDSWSHHLLEITPLICLLASWTLVQMVGKKNLPKFLIFLFSFLIFLFFFQRWQPFLILKKEYLKNLFLYCLLAGLILLALSFLTAKKLKKSFSKVIIFPATLTLLIFLTILNYLINPLLPKRFWLADAGDTISYPQITIKDEKEFGQFLAQNSSSGDTILVIGNPIFSFFAQREPVKGIFKNQFKTLPWFPTGLVSFDFISPPERKLLIDYYRKNLPKLVIVADYHWSDVFKKSENKDIANLILNNYQELNISPQQVKSNSLFLYYKIFRLK